MSVKKDLNARNMDPVKLISAVKMCPALWNTRCPGYKTKKAKERAWNKIASEVVDEWQGYDPIERQMTLRFLMKRWNNIRDYHVKSLKARRRKKYAFSDHLAFLQPELERKMQLVSQVDDFKIETHDVDVEVIEEIPSEEEVEEDFITIVDSLDHTYEESNHSSRQESLRYDDVPKTEDSDLMFLKSLLPDMKKLDDDDKFAFKFAIMQTYMGILKKRHSTKL